jgi:hypothetical protein
MWHALAKATGKHNAVGPFLTLKKRLLKQAHNATLKVSYHFSTSLG